MKEKGVIVEPDHMCPAFSRSIVSLDEEPAACENCEYYEEGRCFVSEITAAENNDRACE